MAEVIEQINKMTREEKIRLAHLLLDATEHGTVVKKAVRAEQPLTFTP